MIHEFQDKENVFVQLCVEEKNIYEKDINDKDRTKQAFVRRCQQLSLSN